MAGSHHIVHPVMRLDAEAVRSRMNSGASPHHRIVFAESEITAARAGPEAPSPAADRLGNQVDMARQGGLAGGHITALFHDPQKQSGDVVRTRINSGASPLLHRARTLSAEAVRTRMNSGASPHHRFAPDFWAEKQDGEASGG